MRPEKDMFLSGMQVLVNPVNCVGAMGKGLAVQFRTRFPNMAKRYVRDCKQFHTYQPSCCIMYVENGTIIANLATENHYRNGARKLYIESALYNLKKQMIEKGYTSVAIPRIGCGLGGLDWNDIRPLILSILKDVPFTVWLDGEVISPVAPQRAHKITNKKRQI